MPDDKLLTIREAAMLLKLAEKTVYSMARRKEIRGQWRIRRLDYDRWMAEQAEAGREDRG